ncbi:MAG: transposase [Actinomycetota bacterium]
MGEVAGIGRFCSDARVALHAGVAPLPASSGSSTHVRMNRTGNCWLNAALHRIAVTQIRKHEPPTLYMNAGSPKARPSVRPFVP